jgi:uncharacterized membrane protein
MTDLIVVGFKKDRFRASEVRNQLRVLNKDWALDLQDAVAVYHYVGGQLRNDQSWEMSRGEHAGWGGFWGSLVGLLSGAVTGCSSRQALWSVFGWSSSL